MRQLITNADTVARTLLYTIPISSKAVCAVHYTWLKWKVLHGQQRGFQSDARYRVKCLSKECVSMQRIELQILDLCAVVESHHCCWIPFLPTKMQILSIFHVFFLCVAFNGACSGIVSAPLLVADNHVSNFWAWKLYLI